MQQSPSLVRYAALLAIAAIVPVLVFAGFSAVGAYAQRQDELRGQAIAEARRLSEAVDRELTASLDAAQALAALPALDGAMDLDAFAEIARREQLRHPLWLTVLVLDPEGRRLTNSRTPARLGAAVDPPSLDRAVKTKRPTVGALTKGPVEYGIPVRAPVVRDGRVNAVVTVVVHPKGVSDLLAASDLPPTWLAAVVDRDGRLAGRSQSPEPYVGRMATHATLEQRNRAARGVYDGQTLDGQPMVVAFWRSALSGWSVHIGMPKAAFEAPLRRSITISAIGSALSLLLAGAFVALLVRELRLRRQETAALEQSNRMEALGRLTGGVAHDFNNLLMIIQGNAEILQRRIQGDGGQRPLAAIREATARAAKLTRELLVFARGEPAERTRLDLNATVHDFLESIGQAVGPNVTIATDLDPDAGVIEVDRVQFELTLLNLAVNARDAMQGSGELRIATRRLGPTAVELVISDSGPGIPPEIAGRVFDPFFTTKPVGKGTGLGLTQVYGFAKQAGGDARVALGERRGAAVALRLPTSSGPAAAPEDKAAETGAGDLMGRRILLLDDNAEVRAVSGQHLREQGAEVIEGDCAAAGLTALETGTFDALVSDIVMPGDLNGLELAEQVRSSHAAMPILLVSGYSESSAAAVARGFRVMRKPYALSELSAVLAGLIDVGSGADAPA